MANGIEDEQPLTKQDVWKLMRRYPDAPAATKS